MFTIRRSAHAHARFCSRQGGRSRAFILVAPVATSRVKPVQETAPMQAIKTGQATAEGLTSTLGIMRQSKSHHARLRLCRDALKAGFVVDTRATKVIKHVGR